MNALHAKQRYCARLSLLKLAFGTDCVEHVLYLNGLEQPHGERQRQIKFLFELRLIRPRQHTVVDVRLAVVNTDPLAGIVGLFDGLFWGVLLEDLVDCAHLRIMSNSLGKVAYY